MELLVANGCSYVNNWVKGQGHTEFAHQLNIPQAHSLAVDGACNDRIIRTTLEHSLTSPPTLYVIGTTFLDRYELPAGEPFGEWININVAGTLSVNQKLHPSFSSQQVLEHQELTIKLGLYGLYSQLHKLKLQLRALVDSVKSRGHKIVVFNTAEDRIGSLRHSIPTTALEIPEFVDGLSWLSNKYQLEMGAKCAEGDEVLDTIYQHVLVGQHQHLNKFLFDYITQHNL